MDTKKEIRKLKDTEILKRNTKIDAKIVRAQAKLESELSRLGVEVKPEFKVEPPLGQGTMRLCGKNF